MVRHGYLLLRAWPASESLRRVGAPCCASECSCRRHFARASTRLGAARAHSVRCVLLRSFRLSGFQASATATAAKAITNMASVVPSPPSGAIPKIRSMKSMVIPCLPERRSALRYASA